MASGDGGIQFKTCSCGGLLTDEWATCESCGASIGDDDGWSSDEDGWSDHDDAWSNEAPVEPDLRSYEPAGEAAEETQAALIEALTSDEPKTRRSSSRRGVLTPVLVVAGLAAAAFTTYLLLDDDSAEDPEIAAAYEGFCTTDRSGIEPAPRYDPDATDQGVYQHGGVPFDSGTQPSQLRSDPDGKYASVIVCSDVIGEVVDGDICDNYDDGLVYQRRIAFFRVSAHAARTGEELGAVDAGPDERCPPVLDTTDAEGNVVLGTAAADPDAYRDFVNLFVNPSETL